MHATCPVEGWNLPTAHAAHDDATASEDRPASHVVQLVAPAFEYLPAGHTVALYDAIPVPEQK